jgi:hypothetical protein
MENACHEKAALVTKRSKERLFLQSISLCNPEIAIIAPTTAVKLYRKCPIIPVLSQTGNIVPFWDEFGRDTRYNCL